MNKFARGYADALAEAGLFAAVWDIHSGLPLTTDYHENIRRVRTMTDRSVATLVGTWIDAMVTSMGVTSVAVLGFCIGGRFALLRAAEDERIRGCAAAYPSIENPRLDIQDQDALELAATIASPVHLIQAGKDHVTSVDTYAALKQALHRRVAPTIVQLHPEADHGFMHLDQPEANRKATAIASPQMIAFLSACLG